jgi:hypothetical protein
MSHKSELLALLGLLLISAIKNQVSGKTEARARRKQKSPTWEWRKPSSQPVSLTFQNPFIRNWLLPT